MNRTSTVVAEAASFASIVGSIAGWLPPIAALFGIIWTGIQIYESNTFKRVLAKFKGNV